MGRKKLISESQILEAKRRIESKQISLRGMSREIGIDHKSLSARIQQLNNQTNLIAIKTPPKPPKTTNKPPIKEVKPPTKNKTLKINTDFLRGLYTLFYGKSDNHKNNKNQLLDIFIKEFQRQKEGD